MTPRDDPLGRQPRWALLARVGRGVGRALLVPAAVAVARPVDGARRAVSSVADRLVPAVAAAVLSRLDVPALARAYAQPDRLASLVDLDAVARRIDLDAIASRVDVDALVDRVDIDRVLARTDVAGLARYIADEIDLAELLRATAGTASSEMAQGVRDRSAQADLAVANAIDRFLHRAQRQPGQQGTPPDGRGGSATGPAPTTGDAGPGPAS